MEMKEENGKSNARGVHAKHYFYEFVYVYKQLNTRKSTNLSQCSVCKCEDEPTETLLPDHNFQISKQHKFSMFDYVHEFDYVIHPKHSSHFVMDFLPTIEEFHASLVALPD